MLQIITIICVTHVQKNFWIRASIKKLSTKYQIFTILPQISHFHKFRNFSSIFATFETNCFIPINFMAGICQEYSFFHFCQLPPVKLWSRYDEVRFPGELYVLLYRLYDIAPLPSRFRSVINLWTKLASWPWFSEVFRCVSEKVSFVNNYDNSNACLLRDPSCLKCF